MKIIHLNIFFKLPDNFKWDVDKAIEELVKYRKECKKNGADFRISGEGEASKQLPMQTTMETYMAVMFKDFLEAAESGKRVYGEIGMNEYNENTGRLTHVSVSKPKQGG